jgi:hypothetical protein
VQDQKKECLICVKLNQVVEAKMVSPQEFKRAFEAAFLINRKHLLWNSSQRRTAYMMAYIYRTLADSFPGMEVEYEYKNIDAVLYQSSAINRLTDENVVVAVEHENDVRTISTELTNFANHKFPLNVLISYTGNRHEYILSRHSKTLETIYGQMLFILYRDGAPERQRHRVIAVSGPRAGALQRGEQWIITVDQGRVYRDVLLHAGVIDALDAPAAVLGRGNAAQRGAEVILAAGMLDGRRGLGALVHEMVAAASEVARGAHLARVDVSLGHEASAQQRRHVVGIKAVVLGVAAVHRAPGEGVAQDAGNARILAEVGEPGARCTGIPRRPPHPRGRVATLGDTPWDWCGCLCARAPRRRQR